MRELAIAGVWLVFAVGLFMIESDVSDEYLPYVARGKWFALVLAGMNALRPALKWGVRWLLGQLGWGPRPPKESDDAPVKPIVHPELQLTDDRIQNRPPPPDSIRP